MEELVLKNGCIETPDTGVLYLKYGQTMEIKRTATKGELIAMMAALLEVDEVFNEAFFGLAKLTNPQKPDIKNIDSIAPLGVAFNKI